MSPTPKMSLLLLMCLLGIIFFGLWAMNYIHPHDGQNQLTKQQLTAKLTRHTRGVQEIRSHIKRGKEAKSAVDAERGWEMGNDEWENRQKEHQINIVMTNIEDEEQQEHQKDQRVKEALMKLMKFKETKAAPKERRQFDNAPGLDFKREFASDEPNPYIENLCNLCEKS